jgi:glycosyltransferase involved in cell wall biosynthesis
MRVLVVPKWYPWPDRPVFGVFVREHARALATRHDVVVLASDAVRSPDFALYELSDAVEDGLRTLRVRYRRPWFRPAAMACQIVGMIAALRRLRREGWRPEIVHAHVYSAGIPALILGRLSRAPVVVTEHYTGFQRGLISGYERLVARFALRRAALVAPVSEDLAEHLRAIAPRVRIRVVGNVVDTRAFHPPTEPRARDGAVRLLSVGTLTEKKGHRFLLGALARLGGELTLDLVGEGELRPALERQAREWGIAAAVRFHGELPQTEVAELMRQADLLVLPSLFENLPCVLIEAMASGLPFVASDVGGIGELIDGPGAWLCPPGDTSALAETIATALDELEAIDGQALARDAAQRFGYEPFARTWTEIYEELRSRVGRT